jgi:hypothetical protein
VAVGTTQSAAAATQVTAVAPRLPSCAAPNGTSSLSIPVH